MNATGISLMHAGPNHANSQAGIDHGARRRRPQQATHRGQDLHGRGRGLRPTPQPIAAMLMLLFRPRHPLYFLLSLYLAATVKSGLSPLLHYPDAPRVMPSPAAAHGCCRQQQQKKHDAAAAAAAAEVIDYHVDCNFGRPDGDGSTLAPFKSPQAALDAGANRTTSSAAVVTITIADGICHLEAPLKLGPSHSSSVLRGRSPRSVLSGGRPLTGWEPVSWPGAPAGSVFAADIHAWPVEIKTLRHGSAAVPRARWPALVDDGLSTPNWLFAAGWSTHPPKSTRGRALHGLGIDPTKLPASARNLSDLVGGYAHILGCVEKDVNSQMTKILGIKGSSTTHPLAQVMFRGSFTTNQRYFIENVRWSLSEGTFFVDDDASRIYYWPSSSDADVTTQARAPTGVVAPVLDRIIDLAHVHAHTITNITFTDTTYYSDGYWDGPAQQPNDAAIRVNYCANVAIDSCNFVASLGGYGVAIGNASADITVQGSLFDGLGQGGVLLYGFDKSPVPGVPGRDTGNNTQPRRAIITQNVIHNIGTILVPPSRHTCFDQHSGLTEIYLRFVISILILMTRTGTCSRCRTALGLGVPRFSQPCP
jgi:hypothetical protein